MFSRLVQNLLSHLIQKWLQNSLARCLTEMIWKRPCCCFFQPFRNLDFRIKDPFRSENPKSVSQKGFSKIIFDFEIASRISIRIKIFFHSFWFLKNNFVSRGWKRLHSFFEEPKILLFAPSYFFGLIARWEILVRILKKI